MKLKWKILLAIGLVITCLFSVFCYRVNELFKSMDKLGPCGYMGGPVYGKMVSINIDTIKFDQFFAFKNGKFAIKNTKDTLPFLITKFDTKNNVLWTVNLGVMKASNIQLNLNDKSLDFFNESFGEPAHIYFDNNYNFKYLCQLMY